MDNYAMMQEAGRKRFLTYDLTAFDNKKGVLVAGDRIKTSFLGEVAEISLKTGEIVFPNRKAGFGESMCLYDWLCDGKAGACPSRAFAPVSSLPGVMVRGNGLVIDTAPFARKASMDHQRFEHACLILGGAERQAGDMGFEIPLFSDLTALLKLYDEDDEFPASLVLLWDRNILEYIRYETVYYLAGCLLRRLDMGMEDAENGICP